MSIRQDISRGIVAWLRTYGNLDVDDGELAATSTLQAPVARRERVADAHMTFDVLWPGRVVGLSERFADGYRRGDFEATVEVNAYGDEALDWLTAATMALDEEETIDLLTEHGVTVRPPEDGIVSVRTPRDLGHEVRATADFTISCRVVTRPVTTEVEAATVAITTTFEGSSELVEAVEIDVSTE